jgi:hypothetical protein
MPQVRRVVSLLGCAVVVLSIVVLGTVVLGIVVLGTAAPVRAAVPAAAATISVAPLPPVYTASTTYTLKVNGIAVPVNGYTGYDYAAFSMSSGTAQVAVTKLNGTNVGAAYIAPVKYGYTATFSGSTATFTMASAQYLIVKLDGRRQLVIAADPAETDRPATSGAGIFNVTSPAYRADPTGATMSTAAIQRALNDAAAYGTQARRGTVYIPRGVYTVGNLTLNSNTAVYLEDGAVLRMVPNSSLYEMDAYKTSQALNLTWFIRTAFGSSNIKLYGRGTLDGNGAAVRSAGFGMNILVPIATSNFTVDGLTIRESVSWAVIPVRSDNLTFSNLKVFNRFDMGEDDALDVVESQHVKVARGVGVSLDDSYSTKSYKASAGDIMTNWPGSPEPVTDVTFDQLLAWTICYAYKVGQGVGVDQTGITFSNSVVYDAAVAIGIDHKAYTAPVSNVTFSNIDIERLNQGPNAGNQAWLVVMIENSTGDGGGPVTNLTLSHINVRAMGSTASKLDGLSDSSAITGVALDFIKMPGQTSYATSLAAMNITSTQYVSGITILS